MIFSLKTIIFQLKTIIFLLKTHHFPIKNHHFPIKNHDNANSKLPETLGSGTAFETPEQRLGRLQVRRI